ncbi:thioesterase family protein [Aeromicrobium sp. 50.2.37]|uniref:acyl-CoA thioesterase n=1 Tax=Aeromicrobium sp. 50.2.37 TaxID=2969305 RepID=UPI00214F6F8B|nr:acyl-CoA thioesterase [Aeromicrobium sp. 50.2.37]MCR4512652.1 acyl-CoA thioesterase [Aeromicrobium sp. 50.2.37]
MPPTTPSTRFTFPDDVESWWTCSYTVPESSIDELGHMTAVHYPVAFEEAAVAFLDSLWGSAAPDFVVAETHVTYRHEIVLETSPVLVSVATWLVGRTSFGLHAVIADSEGIGCAYSSMRYVVWDREARSKAPLSRPAREALDRRRG